LGVGDTTVPGLGCLLTCDDGPQPKGTTAMLAALARRTAPATFFLVGEQVARDPALAAEIVAAGHQVGLHCDRHRSLLRLTPWQVREDLLRARDRIEHATGVQIDTYRPPYGVFNAAALALARSYNWRPLLWSGWGRDWEARATPRSIVRRLCAHAGEGSVLLLHDADDYGSAGSWRRTLGALPLLWEQLERRGLELVLR
ncbi:MAG: polysaccharide deacetylase family protein, partial [Solirubrobacteraceae bacterium]